MVSTLLKNLYGAMSDISSRLSRNDKVAMEGSFQNMLHLETETSEDGQEQKRPAVNKDGSARKKPGVAPGTKRGIYNKDGSLRKKPGPKSHNEVADGQ